MNHLERFRAVMPAWTVLLWIMTLGCDASRARAEPRREIVVSDMSVLVPVAPVPPTTAERKTLVLSDFGLCEPKTSISKQPKAPGIWQLLDYQAGPIHGWALFGGETTQAHSIVLPLEKQGVRGWYEIRYGMWDPNGPHSRPPGEGIRARLTVEQDWSIWQAQAEGEVPTIYERVWKIADLTGQDLHLAPRRWYRDFMLRCGLAYVKLIPIDTPKRVNTHADTWRLVPYTCKPAGIDNGTAVEVDETCAGGPVMVPLTDRHLHGWYDFYLGLYDPGSPPSRFQYVGLDVRLTDDDAYEYLSMYPLPTGNGSDKPLNTRRGAVKERLWKRARLDGQALQFRQATVCNEYPGEAWKPDYAEFNARAGVAWVRLVPADAPVAPPPLKWPSERLLVNWHDLDTSLMIRKPATQGEVRDLFRGLRAEPYNVLMLDPNGGVSRTCYPTQVGLMPLGYEPTVRILDYRATESRRALATNGVNVVTTAADEAKKMGMRFWVFLRVGAWGYAQPWQTFSTPFFFQHPEFRCVTKNGRPWHTNSYAFPEVRKHVVDTYREIVQDSRAGSATIDGLVLGFSRGPIFLDYEPHVCRAFEAAFGQDPRKLATDDPRWLKFRAKCLTELLVEMKVMLKEQSQRQGCSINLVAETYRNEADNLRFGLDVREWVRQGLADVIQVHTECFTGQFDRQFYKDLRKKHHVRIVIGHLPASDLKNAERNYLNDFDGLELSGPIDSEANLEGDHPERSNGELTLQSPLPPMAREPAPGSKTGQWPFEHLQGIPVGMQFYGSGL